MSLNYNLKTFIMKKFISAALILVLTGSVAFSQKKNGTIYSEHEAIDKTRALWQAFADGDREKYTTFFADSVYITNNGEEANMIAGKNAGGSIGWFSKEVENLEVSDHKPAYPDALDYKEAGVWVQDWLLITGRHTNTGVNLDLPIHNLYRFNDEGKIVFMASYFNYDVFDEINHSETTRENGEVYINHPYIVTVRKMLNSMMDGDLDTWKSFFTPDSRFGASWMDTGKTESFEEAAAKMEKRFATDDFKFKFKQTGYPDCIYYGESNHFVVYSWWNVSIVDGDKKFEIPVMLSHDFNEEGKIFREMVYGSSNHLED